MKGINKKVVVPLIAILALVLMVAWMAGVFSDRVEPGQEALPAAQIDDSFEVEFENQPLYEPVPGSIEALQATAVSSRVLARITSIGVRAGDTVEAGQLLIELEDEDFSSRVQQAQSRIEALQAQVTEAESALQRATELRSTGALSQADLDRARANYDSLRAQLQGARQSLQEAQTALGYTEIRAPIDGVVVDRLAEPGDTASPGVALLSLYNPTTLRVEAQVRESLALSLQEGQELQVEIPALDLTLPAQIEERVPAANPASRSFLIKARLDYSANLLPGMYARLRVPAGEASKALVPADYVEQLGQQDLVYVLVDGQVQRRFVKSGLQTSDGMIEILSGVESGERLVPAAQ